MALTLRRIRWPDGTLSLDPEGREVIRDGEAIGRIYRSASTARGIWLWSIFVGNLPRGRRYNGVADTLDETKAAWLYAWQGP